MKKNNNNQKRAALAKKRHAKSVARKDKSYNPDSAMKIAFREALKKHQADEQKQNSVVGDTVIIA